MTAPVRSHRLRRIAAAVAVATLPLTMAACGEEEPVDGGVVEEEGAEEEDD